MKRCWFVCLGMILWLNGCGYQETQEKDSIVEEEIQQSSSILNSEEMILQETAEKVEEEEMQDMTQEFYWTDLNNDIKEKITGISYPETNEKIEISYEELAYVHVLHYDFQDEIQEGELICNKKLAQDFVEIFKELFDEKYQIEKIRLVDEYGADDMESMTDNNSSCFNYRVISGTTKISNHSYGRAIDINPLYNPYVFHRNGLEQVQPLNANEFVDRSKEFPHKIDHDDLCYKVFLKHGFTWGGDWKNSKDYQHFEKK